MRQREKAVAKKESTLLKMKAEFDEARPKVGSSIASPSDRVKLNIGGTKYETTASTLFSLDYFAAFFNGNYGDKKDSDGFYFIDRDGEGFKVRMGES